MSKGIASFTDEPFLLNMINKKKLAKHYAGEHDQSTHGSWAHGDVNDFTLDKRFQDAVKYYAENPDAWGFYDTTADSLRDSDVGQLFTEYAKKTIANNELISGYNITPRELQFRAMKERLLDEIDAYGYVNNKDIYQSFEDDIVPEITSVMENGKICIAVDAYSFAKIIGSKDPKFKTQFETAKSNGHYDPTTRRAGEARSQSVPISVSDSKRPIYGYLSTDDFDDSIVIDGVEQYGEIRFVLKDSLKERSTMTVGDSLNRKSMPMKLNKTPSVSDVIRASQFTLRNGEDDWSGAEDWADKDYFETQIFGGVSMKDVEKIYIPESNSYYKDIIKDKDFSSKFPDIEIIPYYGNY
jgi:hypothetical protein